MQVRRFRAFFAGWCSAKQSATCFRANLLTVSRVVAVGTLDISEFGVDISEGSACAIKEDRDSEWVVLAER